MWQSLRRRPSGFVSKIGRHRRQALRTQQGNAITSILVNHTGNNLIHQQRSAYFSSLPETPAAASVVSATLSPGTGTSLECHGPSNRSAVLVLSETLLASQRLIRQGRQGTEISEEVHSVHVNLETSAPYHVMSSSLPDVESSDDDDPPHPPHASVVQQAPGAATTTTLEFLPMVKHDDKQIGEETTATATTMDFSGSLTYDAGVFAEEQTAEETTEPQTSLDPPSPSSTSAKKQPASTASLNSRTPHLTHSNSGSGIHVTDLVDENGEPKIVKLFGHAIDKKKFSKALYYFRLARTANLTDKLPKGPLLALFHRLLNRKDPTAAHAVLIEYVKRLDTENTARDHDYMVTLYHRLCVSLKDYAIPEGADLLPNQLESLTRNLLVKFQTFSEKDRQRLLPALVSSLAEQRLVSLGALGRHVYDRMVQDGFNFSPQFLRHLLRSNKYQRMNNLPYPEIFATAVEKGERPEPIIVNRLVENCFPFSDTRELELLLQGVVALESTRDPADNNRYLLDINILELIAASIVRHEDTNIIRTLWQYIEVSGIEPTESIYESTAVAFCVDPDLYPNAFNTLQAMEVRSGYVPSRPLIRSMARKIRKFKQNFEHAMKLFLTDVDKWLTTVEDIRNRENLSVPTLNVVMASAADRGDLENSVHLMNMIREADLPADVDTFSFAFEALGKHLTFADKNRWSKRIYNRTRSYCMARAMEYLDMMDARQIPMNQDVIRAYVYLLNAVGETQTATKVVLDALERGKVDGRTLYLMAMANADCGNFAEAYHLARSHVEEMPWAIANIKAKETPTAEPGGASNDTSDPRYSSE